MSVRAQSSWMASSPGLVWKCVGKGPPDQQAVSEWTVLVQVMTVSACIGWMAASSALIMINKYIMSSDGFRFPMVLSCLGMLFSSVASYAVCRVSARTLF